MEEPEIRIMRFIDSDKFLSLPQDSQAVWFHLMSRTDGKAFALLSPRLAKRLKLSSDNLTPLIDGGFLKVKLTEGRYIMGFDVCLPMTNDQLLGTDPSEVGLDVSKLDKVGENNGKRNICKK